MKKSLVKTSAISCRWVHYTTIVPPPTRPFDIIKVKSAIKFKVNHIFKHNLSLFIFFRNKSYLY